MISKRGKQKVILHSWTNDMKATIAAKRLVKRLTGKEEVKKVEEAVEKAAERLDVDVKPIPVEPKEVIAK